MAQVGTFCIACAILTLPDVGPRDQPGQDPILLLTTVAAILWGAALTVATVVCCVGMVALARRSRRRRPTSGGVALGVYVTAQVTPSPPSPSPHPNRGPEPAPDPSPCSNPLIQVAPAFSARPSPTRRVSQLSPLAGHLRRHRDLGLQDVRPRDGVAASARGADCDRNLLRARQRDLAHPRRQGRRPGTRTYLTYLVPAPTSRT